MAARRSLFAGSHRHIALIAVVLAPLWEELTFRGFLLSALANTRIGFWGGAIVANILWTSLHATYSWAGVASVFLAGLILSWLSGAQAPSSRHHYPCRLGNVFALAFTYGLAPPSLPIPA